MLCQLTRSPRQVRLREAIHWPYFRVVEETDRHPKHTPCHSKVFPLAPLSSVMGSSSLQVNLSEINSKYISPWGCFFLLLDVSASCLQAGHVFCRVSGLISSWSCPLLIWYIRVISWLFFFPFFFGSFFHWKWMCEFFLSYFTFLDLQVYQTYDVYCHI